MKMISELAAAQRDIKTLQEETAELQKLCESAASGTLRAAGAMDAGAMRHAALAVNVALKRADKVMNDIDTTDKRIQNITAERKISAGSKKGISSFPDSRYTSAVLDEMRAVVTAESVSLRELKSGISDALKAADTAETADKILEFKRAGSFAESLAAYSRKMRDEH